ncbi:MAG: Crp/Fnr family transcriptional regulator [Anaerolineae bacterium]
MPTQALIDIPLFTGLSGRERMRIAGSLRQRQYKAGSMVFHEGDPGDALYVVRTGMVRIYTGGRENGFETSVILFGRPGDVFGELAVIDGDPRSASAKAMEDTLVYVMARETFQHHMELIPKLAINFMSLMARKMRSNTRHMDSLASQNVSERLAKLLVKLMDDFGRRQGNQVVLDIHLNQTELASMIGATRESTNRAMRNLKKQDIVGQQNGKLFVRDTGALRELGT